MGGVGVAENTMEREGRVAMVKEKPGRGLIF
jgi:hypothetical protein